MAFFRRPSEKPDGLKRSPTTRYGLSDLASFYRPAPDSINANKMGRSSGTAATPDGQPPMKKFKALNKA